METDEIKFLKKQIKNALKDAGGVVADCRSKKLGLTDNEFGKFQGRVTAYQHILFEISYLNDNMAKGKASK